MIRRWCAIELEAARSNRFWTSGRSSLNPRADADADADALQPWPLWSLCLKVAGRLGMLGTWDV
jgi:hypothetical protein